MTSKQSTYAIEVHNLTVVYNNEPVLWNVSVGIPLGIMMAVVGPNGAGKTTLIKSILGLIQPLAGTITIFGTSQKKNRYPIAYIPQRSSVDWDFPINVLDVVLMGRYGHIGWIRRPNNYDKQKAFEALEQVNLAEYADRHISQLSGGQQQRVFLARALVQDASIYLMDEPFTGVDIASEKMIIKVLQTLRSQGKTIVVVHHDLQTLADYFDWILLLNVQQIACGPVNQVLMTEYICAAYGDRTIFVPQKKTSGLL